MGGQLEAGPGPRPHLSDSRHPQGPRSRSPPTGGDTVCPEHTSFPVTARKGGSLTRSHMAQIPSFHAERDLISQLLLWLKIFTSSLSAVPYFCPKLAWASVLTTWLGSVLASRVAGHCLGMPCSEAPGTGRQPALGPLHLTGHPRMFHTCPQRGPSDLKSYHKSLSSTYPLYMPHHVGDC